MLSIKNLHVSVNDKLILKGLNLEVKKGEIHAIMGPNGSGKSTLTNVIAGREIFKIEKGEIIFKNKNIIELDVTQRAQNGIFVAFQYPVEIPGVSILNFIRTAVAARRKYLNLNELSPAEFLKLMKEKQQLVQLTEKLANRSVNEGFSGGEKKKNEIFQMAMLEPDLAILDETDSGLDIDALKIVANGVNKLKTPENSFIVITHYQRLLDFIVPDYVHVLYDGRIVKSGNKDLALELEEKGYDWIKKEFNNTL